MRGGHIKTLVLLREQDIAWVTMPSGDDGQPKPCMFVHLPKGSNITQRLVFGHYSKGDLNMAHTSVIETLMVARDKARMAEVDRQADVELARLMERKIDISFDGQNRQRKQLTAKKNHARAQLHDILGATDRRHPSHGANNDHRTCSEEGKPESVELAFDSKSPSVSSSSIDARVVEWSASCSSQDPTTDARTKWVEPSLCGQDGRIISAIFQWPDEISQSRVRRQGETVGSSSQPAW